MYIKDYNTYITHVLHRYILVYVYIIDYNILHTYLMDEHRIGVLTLATCWRCLFCTKAAL